MNDKFNRVIKKGDKCFYVSAYYTYFVEVVEFTKYRVVVDVIVDADVWPSFVVRNICPKTVAPGSLIIFRDPRQEDSKKTVVLDHQDEKTKKVSFQAVV